MPFHSVIVVVVLPVRCWLLLKSPLRCNQLLNAIEATALLLSPPVLRDNDAAKQKPLRWKLFNEAFVSQSASRTRPPLTISCLPGMSVSVSVSVCSHSLRACLLACLVVL